MAGTEQLKFEILQHESQVAQLREPPAPEKPSGED
jgi:hypothetical protein